MKKIIPFLLSLLALSSCSTSQTVYKKDTLIETDRAIFSLENCSISPAVAILNLTVTTKNESIQRLD